MNKINSVSQHHRYSFLFFSLSPICKESGAEYTKKKSPKTKLEKIIKEKELKET